MKRRAKVPGLLNDELLQKYWHAFKQDHNQHAREQLILHYQPLVHGVAKRVGGTLPAHIDDEDLVSYGLFGLMDAMEKFDLAREIKFETYASTRIRGAIIDELRTIDWIPRSVRSQVRDINQATAALEAELQREPTPQEIADHIGITLAELHKHKGQQNFIHMVALDAHLDQDSDDQRSTSIGAQLEDNRTQSPVLAYETEEIKYNLANAVASLSEREAIVLCLYYYEGLTLAEIGQALKVTESRVCQMHTRAMSAVRGRLADVA
jgi:RNA polymerase sigma factor for flagellar operon FliA